MKPDFWTCNYCEQVNVNFHDNCTECDAPPPRQDQRQKPKQENAKTIWRNGAKVRS